MPLRWIIFAAFFIPFAIFAGVYSNWQWIVHQPPSAAAFLGALAGAGGGLLAIILGALLNAELNRRRDDRLRNKENTALAIAFRAELFGLMSEASVRLGALKRFDDVDQPIAAADSVQLNISAKAVYADNTRRLGGLGDRVALSVVAAHGHADHIRHNVAAMLAQTPGAVIEELTLEVFHKDFRKQIELGARAVNALDAFLGVPERFPDPKALAAEADPAGPDAPEVPAKAGPDGAPAEPTEPDPAQVP